jgi:ribosome recycling factor
MPLPELSRERRQEFVKLAHKLAEEGHVSVRNVRRDSMEVAKKQQKEGKLSEDDARRIEKEVQVITDRFIKDIDAHLAAKEKELTTM